jgi:cytochrome c5
MTLFFGIIANLFFHFVNNTELCSMKFFLNLLFVALLMAACAPKQFYAPNDLDIERGRTKFPNYTLVEMNRGKIVYSQNCGNCHAYKNPSKYSESEWNEIVPRMVKKANKNDMLINKEEAELLRKFVITMSLRPLD